MKEKQRKLNVKKQLIYCYSRHCDFSDEDMQSMASLMSVNNTSDDIAALEDVEDDDFSLSQNDNSIKSSINEVTQHLQQMTNSLSGSDFASTPISDQLLKLFISFSINF